jgi:hypothetical protein
MRGKCRRQKYPKVRDGSSLEKPSLIERQGFNAAEGTTVGSSGSLSRIAADTEGQ